MLWYYFSINLIGRKISENDKSSRTTVTHQEPGRNLFLRNNININEDENGKLIRSQSVTNNKVKMKEIQPLNFDYQQNTAGSIPNGTISQSCVKTTKQVGTSTPKEIKRRLTFNILDNHRKSSVLDEISEENTKDSCSKV